MVDLIMGAKVINKAGEKGTIVSLENNYIKVDFVSRVATLQQDAFEKGFLKYENAELQNTVVKIIEQAKIEEERKIEQVRIVAEKAKQEIKPKQAKRTEKISNDKDISVKVNLDASPVNLNSIGTKDKEFFQKLFNECDKDIKTLFDLFDPKMAYYKYTSRSRSKYSVGFLTKYLDTYVFRVFMRNDIYKKGIRTGITILQSDSTEILRIICLNGKVFYFSKNISLSMGFYNISRSFNKWHDTSMAEGVILNDVIRKCDCKYLNDYISEKKINCYQYTKLLFPALENSKVEIVFKNKLFLATYRITDLVEYFEKFSSKQIDFASKNNVINTLPIIKDYGVLDIDILQDMEKIMKKQSYHNSIYDTLLEAFKRLNFDYTDLGKRLIGFLEKVDYFDAGVYRDFIYELSERHDVTMGDFFDKNYIARHDIMMKERKISYDKEKNEKYSQVAKELSWIDREENGHLILVPKTINEFKYEGEIQHNCVYTMEYFNRVIERQSIVVFLRNEKDIPYVTIEFDYETFDVLQARGKYNKKIDKDLYQFIVDLGKNLYYELLSQ